MKRLWLGGRRRLRLKDIPARDRVAYVCLRVANRWFATVCHSRGEAAAVAQWLADEGAEYVFAGEASSLSSAHWQLRQAFNVTGDARGSMPWIAFPQLKGGRGVNPQLLRTSFENAINADELFVEHFYDALWHEDSRLRHLFPRTMSGQVAAFGEKLTELMLHLEEEGYLQKHLPALGERHRERYGVRAEMFLPVARALTGTLKKAVGGWGDQEDELTKEWTELLLNAASLMGFPKEDVLAATG